MFIGLVGKPSAGKSTFFKAATLMDVATANYPFTTIKPNSGVGFVKVECVDKEFEVQCMPKEGYCEHNERFVPVRILDVAGLVPGAHEGKGMGLEFLNDLNQADVLIHIVDVSGSLNEKGEPMPDKSYDPSKDIEFLEHELDMWYFQIFQKVWKKFSNTVNQQKENVVKAIAEQFSGMRVTEEIVKNALADLDINKPIIKWSEEDLRKLTKKLRKETKPIIIAANKIDVPGAEEKYEKLKKDYADHMIIPCSSESELALREASRAELIDYVPGTDNFKILKEDKLSNKQKNALEFIRKNVLKKYGKTGVQEILDRAVYDILENIAVFPVPNNKLKDADGNILPDCYLVHKDTTPLQLAFKIHTKFGDNFIKAVDVKTNMGLKKDEALEHRSVVEIVHN